MKAKLWEDLRPHRASVCPHMFVCLSSSRIWSTYGFWAGRGRLSFGHIQLSWRLQIFHQHFQSNCALSSQYGGQTIQHH